MSCFHDHVADYLEPRPAAPVEARLPGVRARPVRHLPGGSWCRDANGRTGGGICGAAARGVPQHLSRRLSVLRGFARYLKTVGPATEVPPAGVRPAGQVRPAPYIWAEEDITRLVDAGQDLRPRLKGLTLGTLFGLLASSGIRVGEALWLAAGDVDLGSGLLHHPPT